MPDPFTPKRSHAQWRPPSRRQSWRSILSGVRIIRWPFRLWFGIAGRDADRRKMDMARERSDRKTVQINVMTALVVALDVGDSNFQPAEHRACFALQGV